MPIRQLTITHGFTLIELLVAMTIVGILSVIGITTYSGLQSRARDTQRIDDARKIITVLEQFKSGAGKYPILESSADGSWHGSSEAQPWIPGVDVSNFKDGKIPVDPKNSGQFNYFYRSDSTGSDYCLEIRQENDVSGHPYYYGKLKDVNAWQLHFGPKGAKSGVCA